MKGLDGPSFSPLSPITWLWLLVDTAWASLGWDTNREKERPTGLDWLAGLAWPGVARGS